MPVERSIALTPARGLVLRVCAAIGPYTTSSASWSRSAQYLRTLTAFKISCKVKVLKLGEGRIFAGISIGNLVQGNAGRPTANHASANLLGGDPVRSICFALSMD